MHYNFIMWILLLFFTSTAFSLDMSSEKYCFSSNRQAQIAQHKVSMIQLPSDVIRIDGQCLVVQMESHRRELIQRYILMTFPEAVIAFSSEDVRREPCRLKVEKEKIKSADELNAGLNYSSGISTTASNSVSKETMEIVTLKEFELTVDQDQIKGACRYINPNRYEVTIEVRKNPRPLVPQALPPGSIVVVQGTPPDQEASLLSTQIQLSRGDRVNIGEVVKNLKDKSASVDVRPEVKIETHHQSSTEIVFLSLQ